MPRPALPHPTPGELEVLKILWDSGPLTVRDVMDRMDRQRAYTSVMSLLNVMTDKRLLVKKPQGRAFVYEAAVERGRTLGRMVTDLLGRAFEGSANELVAHVLEASKPDEVELDLIRDAINEYIDQSRE